MNPFETDTQNENDAISHDYFEKESSQIILNELNNLSIPLDCSEITTRIGYLKSQETDVYNRLISTLNLNSENIEMEIQKNIKNCDYLENSVKICKSISKDSNESLKRTTQILKMIYNVYYTKSVDKKLKLLAILSDSLNVLNSIDEFIMKKELFNACNLYLQSQDTHLILKDCKCYKHIRVLRDSIYVKIQNSAKELVFSIYHNFEQKCYEELLKAIYKLNIAKDIFQSIPSNMTLIIKEMFIETLVIGNSSNFENDEIFMKYFDSALKKYSGSDLIILYQAICEKIWISMINFTKFSDFHNDVNGFAKLCENTPSLKDKKDILDDLKSFSDNIKIEFWKGIEEYMCLFLNKSNMNVLKFDDFIQFVEITNRLHDIGCSFSKSKSTHFKHCFESISKAYYEHYHQTNLEELKTFLEIETWENCPLPDKFKLTDMIEFKFLTLNQTIKDSSADQSFNYFYSNNISPFESNANSSENIKNNDSTEIKNDSDVEDHEFSFLGENVESIFIKEYHDDSEGIFICNSFLSILRMCGGYIRAMKYFGKTFWSHLSIFQIFDYSLYSILLNFGSINNLEFSDYLLATNPYSPSLISEINKIYSKLFESTNTLFPIKIDRPSFFAKKDDSPPNLAQLYQRTVAIKSLFFVIRQLVHLRKYIKTFIKEEEHEQMDYYYKHIISISIQIRRAVYYYVSESCLRPDEIVSSISTTNFGIIDIISQHSIYVQKLIQSVKQFQTRLESIKLAHHIPTSVINLIWSMVPPIIFRILIEGYSKAKKCTPEGRALMQLDFQQFIITFEKIYPIKPIPGKEDVLSFIKAYYLPDADLEVFIKEKREVYTEKQLLSLNRPKKIHSQKASRG